MKEYILKFGEGLYNDETGEMCFKPEYVGELIRCKECIYSDLDEEDDYESYVCEYDGSYGKEANHFCGYAKREDNG